MNDVGVDMCGEEMDTPEKGKHAPITRCLAVCAPLETSSGVLHATGSMAPGVPVLCSPKCLCREQRKGVKIELST